MVGVGVGSLPSKPGGQTAGAGGVDVGPNKEMALTLQCQMPRKVAEIRLKFFRLSSPSWLRVSLLGVPKVQ